MRVDKAIVYCEREGYRGLELDVYRPDDDDPRPLVLYVHGGGWRVSHRSREPRETREWSPSFFERLVDAGFVVAANDYRFSHEATFPAQIDDTATALAWLRDHAEDVGIDASRVAVFGASAGGHLASLLALDPANGPIGGTVCWYPITDLSVSDQTADHSFEADLIGGPVGENPDAAAAASPINRVHGGAAPFHIVHGTADEMVDVQHGINLAQKLESSGVDVSLRLVEGADHFFVGREDEVEPIFNETVAFLTRVTATS